MPGPRPCATWRGRGRTGAWGRWWQSCARRVVTERSVAAQTLDVVGRDLGPREAALAHNPPHLGGSCPVDDLARNVAQKAKLDAAAAGRRDVAGRARAERRAAHRGRRVVEALLRHDAVEGEPVLLRGLVDRRLDVARVDGG